MGSKLAASKMVAISVPVVEDTHAAHIFAVTPVVEVFFVLMFFESTPINVFPAVNAKEHFCKWSLNFRKFQFFH